MPPHPPKPSPPETLTQTLLNRAFSPDTARQVHDERLQRRPLILTPTPREPSVRAQRRQARNAKHEAEQRRKKKGPRPLSAKRKRALGLLELDKAECRWSVYEGLHRLWVGYVREILGIGEPSGVGHAEGEQTSSARDNGDVKEKKVYISPASAGPILASMDMHGALICVSRSTCVSRVGISGIVVRDSRFCFDVVTRGNCVKKVPKEGTVFRIVVPGPGKEIGAGEGYAGERPEAEGQKQDLVFEIRGNMFQSRAPDRANKKWKMHYKPDI